MSNISNFKSILPDSLERLHHAYCFEGNRESILNQLLEFLENVLNFAVVGNPDFYLARFETLGIDDGRAINEMQLRKAVSSLRRIFAISANFITKETQNSLLKMFEEPSGGAVFFLIVPSASILLPTLRSRMMIANFNNGGSDVSSNKEFADVKKFIRSNLAQRLVMVKDIADKISDGEAGKSVASDFLNNLEREILSKSATPNDKQKNLQIFYEIDKCGNYLNDRSPSVKMILEHIAMML